MNDPIQSGPAKAPQAAGGVKRWLKRLVIAFVGMSLLGGGLVGVAEHRTSQPEFCASCHNMVPYYESWHADVHGGKLGAYCVDCHYAPGEKTTISAKLRGLSQVASYFSGYYGATRPRAHVTNASCLASKCHGDLRFMDKPLALGTVVFVHAKHLKRTPEMEQPHLDRLHDREAALKALVGARHFAELEEVARQSGPQEERSAKLVALCRAWNVSVESDVLVDFATLQHRPVRLSQLSDLQCKNCHAYNSHVGAKGQKPSRHFEVRTSTCFTCHFNNEGFNVGTNRCLMCHRLEDKPITVHAKVSADIGRKLETPELRTKTVTMTHADIVSRKISCLSCHADVARQTAKVTRRDCQRCHDQPQFFAEWKEPLTVDLVMKFHKAHVQNQRAECLDCHSEIQHRVIRDPEQSGSFLSTSLNNCTGCHPNHHAAQVALLTGTGGQGVAKSEPNPMFGSHTNCYGCHIQPDLTAEKGQVVRGTQETCVACHGERYRAMFKKWKTGIQTTLEDAESAVQDAKKLLAKNTSASAASRQKAALLLAMAEADLRLVKQGNGIHNVTYAIELLDSISTHCQEASAALGKK